MIRYYPDDVLRKACEPVDEVTDEVRELCDHMVEVMTSLRAQGLAAPQIGVSKRIFVINTGGEPEVLINPTITEKHGLQKIVEGCLSFPGVQELVERAEEITVEYTDKDGQSHVVCFDGLDATAAQHEYDHLDGVLFIDRVSALKRRLMLKKLKKTLRKSKPKVGKPNKKRRNARK